MRFLLKAASVCLFMWFSVCTGLSDRHISKYTLDKVKINVRHSDAISVDSSITMLITNSEKNKKIGVPVLLVNIEKVALTLLNSSNISYGAEKLRFASNTDKEAELMHIYADEDADMGEKRLLVAMVNPVESKYRTSGLQRILIAVIGPPSR